MSHTLIEDNLESTVDEEVGVRLKYCCGSQSMAARPLLDAQEVSSIGKRRETTRNSRKVRNKVRNKVR